MKTTKRITVLLADDHEVVRQGLRAILGEEEDIEVVGEAVNGRQAVELMKELRPDVIVMDIGMPFLNGLEATRQILKLAPAAKVLILSAHNEDDYIARVLDVGASGYLLKHTSAEFLANAIREVNKGNRMYSPVIAKRIQDPPANSPGHDSTSKLSHLTPREMELVQLVAEGQANKQIAVELAISIKTVEKHRQHVMDKLNIHDTAGVTRYAIAARIIDCSYC